MKQVLQNLSSGETIVIDGPAPMLSKKSLKIATTVSLISAGTERMLVDFGKSSYLDKARQQPEKVKMVMDKLSTEGLMQTYDSVKSKLDQPIPLGYSNVGVVQEVGSEISEYQVGDRVVSNGPHADVVVVKKNLCSRIPNNVDDDSAAFTVVGSIGLQGVRLAKPSIGESFVVIGAGLIGLLVIQILRANGCRVLALDYDEKKLELAAQFGAETCNATSGDIFSKAGSWSRERGADGVIITASTKSNDPVKQAAQVCRKGGRIILIGVVGLDLDREDFYEKEISFKVSCSYGPGRYDPSYEEEGNDYPIGYVRWTEQRNFEAFLDLLSSGAVNVKPLISSRFDFLDADQAYMELSSNVSGLGILLDYPSDIKGRQSKSIDLEIQNYQFSEDDVTIGFLGAGNYASRILIPAFKRTEAKLHSLASANGFNSVIHGKKSGFKKATTDVEEILKDPEINTLVVATQHDTHSKYVIDGLNANKNVWVEKPLAIDLDSLSLIEEAYSNSHNKATGSNPGPQLMVGFNRRFAPQVKRMKELLSSISAPMSVIITINAGSIPKEHWTQDSKVGGGRIIGECCHFIDLMRFLVGTKIVSISGQSMTSNGPKVIMEDCSSITLGFEDGSFGTIHYLSNGASNFPKESVEVFSDGKVLKLDNYRKLRGYGWKGFKRFNLWKQDKGQKLCAKAFIEGIKAGSSRIPIEEIFEVARVTIEANDLLKNRY